MELYKIKEQLMSGKKIDDLKFRVTFYARVSTDKDEQLNSLDNQIEYFKKYISNNPNWTYIDGYIDEGISGSSVKGRVNFLRMIEDGKNGLFDLIITKEISRFSRNLADSIKYINELLSYNVGVYFQTNSLITFDSNSEVFLNLFGSFAQEEIKRLSERVRWGLNESKKRGRVLGNDRITGYKKDKTKLVIVEEEAKFIRVMFELYSTGRYGFSRLSMALADKGYVNSKGKMYSYSTLKRMIENPKYKGYYRTNTVKTADYRDKKQIRTSKDEWTVYKSEDIPSIISEELWDKCNEILNKRTKKYEENNIPKTAYANRYNYSGLLYCSEHNVTFQRDTGAKTKRKVKWVCGEYRRHHLRGCLTPILVEEELDDIFKRIMKDLFSNKEDIIKNMLLTYSTIKTEVNYSKEIAILKNNIEEIHVKKDKLLEHNIAGRINDEEFKKRNDSFNNEVSKLNKTIEKYEYEQSKFNRGENRLKEVEKNIRQQFEFTDNLYDFIKAFVDKIIVSKVNNDRSNIQLDIYLKIGYHLVYKDGIITPYNENNNNLAYCSND